MPSYPTIPPSLSSHLFSYPPPGSLTLITSVSGASANWIVLRHIWAALKPEPSTKKEIEPVIIFISWQRGLDFWKDAARKLGLNLTGDTRITFVDALQSGLGLQHGGTGEVETLLLNAIKKTASPDRDVMLILDGIDFLLGAASLTSDEVKDAIWALRENVHSTIVSVAADYSLIQAQSTPLELHHAAFVLSIAHQAKTIWEVRELDTGSARDVSGVLRISRGPAVEEEEEPGVELEEKELLYHVTGDNGVKVFERGSS